MNYPAHPQATVITASNRTEHPELPALDDLFLQAEQAGISLAVLKIPDEKNASDPMARSRHDIKGSLRTLRLAVDSIAGGYRFDDERATAKIDALGKALKVVESQLGRYLELIKA